MKPFAEQLMRLCLICVVTILCSCGSARIRESEVVSLELYGPYLTTSSMLTVDVELDFTAPGAGLGDETAASAVVSVDRGLLLRPEGRHGAAAIGSSFEIADPDWLYWILPETEGLAHISATSEYGSMTRRISVARAAGIPARIDFRMTPARLGPADSVVEIEAIFEYLPGPPACNNRPYDYRGQPQFTFHAVSGKLQRTAPEKPPVNQLPSAVALTSIHNIEWRPYERLDQHPPQETKLLLVMQWGDLTAARLLEVAPRLP